MQGVSKVEYLKEGPVVLVWDDAPEEAIFRQETFGENALCLIGYPTHGFCLHTIESYLHPLFKKYVRGKANRDWWFKEIGWWNKWAPLYAREEFVSHLTPECYLELFGVQPASMRVRWLFDNNYTLGELERDEGLASLGLEIGPEGKQIMFTTPAEFMKTLPNTGCHVHFGIRNGKRKHLGFFDTEAQAAAAIEAYDAQM